METFCRTTPSRPLDTARAQAEWTLQLTWSANEAVLEVLSGLDGGCTLTRRRDHRKPAESRSCRRYPRLSHQCTGAHHRSPRTTRSSTRWLANGMITAEEAQTSPERNKILRSLGSLRGYQAGYVDSLESTQPAATLVLEAGDAVLLVSDGVWGEVSDDHIGVMAERHADDPQALAEALVDEAVQMGAPRQRHRARCQESPLEYASSIRLRTYAYLFKWYQRLPTPSLSSLTGTSHCGSGWSKRRGRVSRKRKRVPDWWALGGLEPTTNRL